MTWLRSDDGEWCAPWVVAAGPAAYGVYKRLEGYCAQNLTDGRVPGEMAQMLRASVDLQVLIDHGRLFEEPAGFFLPHFLDNNPSRAQAEADAATRKNRAKRAADARWKDHG